jgi:hypothetical protein
MPELNSQFLARVEYDPRGKLLFVTFRNERCYTYEGVPPSVYAALLRTGAPGAFFNQYIARRYPFRRESA